MPYSEFDFIALVAEKFKHLTPFGVSGIGDDCAVLPISGSESLVVTTDMLNEDVHFIRDRITPFELGRKALAVNLSDVAAMGVAPCGSFLSVGLPAELGERWREDFLEGFLSMSEFFGVPLLGGDTTASAQKITINVTAIGRAENSCIKLRNAAQAGDVIAVTGFLGESAVGFSLLSDKKNISDDERRFVERHNNPTPHVDEGKWLGTHAEVHAMMDVSDGIASDLRHITKASDTSATVEITSSAVSRDLLAVCEKHGWDAAEKAFAWGEDYVLLLTVAPETFDALNDQFEKRFGRTMHAIGKILQNNTTSIQWTQNGVVINKPFQGFSHKL